MPRYRTGKSDGGEEGKQQFRRCVTPSDWLYPEQLLHLVPEVVDDLDADVPACRPRKRARHGGVQLRPSGLADLGLKSPLEAVVRIVANEVGLTDEKALLVIVVVDEPRGDVVQEVLAARGA